MSELQNVPKSLWGKVIEFNFSPQLDHGYLVDALKPLAAAEVEDEFLLAKAAARAFKGLPKFYDFSTPFRRLALLQPKKLWQLILYAGTALHHRSLRKVIDKVRVKDLRRKLGSAYDFALNAAPLLAPPKTAAEMPQAAAEFALSGHQLLATAMAKEPPALQNLWELRFPANLGRRTTVDDDELTTEAAAFLVRVGRQIRE